MAKVNGRSLDHKILESLELKEESKDSIEETKDEQCVEQENKALTLISVLHFVETPWL